MLKADASHRQIVPPGIAASWRRILGGFSIVAFTSPLVAQTAFAATPEADFVLVPEMETPAHIVAQPRSERAALQSQAAGQAGLAALEDRVRHLWPQIRKIDVEALSRHQLEATRGWRLPVEPGDWVGQVMGRDGDRWYLELRGPRLPARYDIVHRYLHVYASYDPSSQSLDDLTITIRGWVLE